MTPLPCCSNASARDTSERETILSPAEMRRLRIALVVAEALESVKWNDLDEGGVADATYYLIAAAWQMARRHHRLQGRSGELPRPQDFPWTELLDDIEAAG